MIIIINYYGGKRRQRQMSRFAGNAAFPDIPFAIHKFSKYTDSSANLSVISPVCVKRPVQYIRCQGPNPISERRIGRWDFCFKSIE